MKTGNQIILIYSHSNSEIAKRITEWLEFEQIAHIDYDDCSNATGACRVVFDVDNHIPTNAAVILVSDDATADDNWQRYVRELPNDTQRQEKYRKTIQEDLYLRQNHYSLTGV